MAEIPKTIKTTVLVRVFSQWLNTGAKALDFSRKLSEYIFTILKLFAGMALFAIILSVVYLAVRDHGKISVKPFSVSENMQKNHKAAGSIVANIFKQKLSITRSNVDAIIRGSATEDKRRDNRPEGRPEDLISHDGFFKGENIKLPETGISINDVIEFISGLFGRKTITGSIYQDQNVLYLQVEVDGKIFTTESETSKSDKDSLHTNLIKKMSDEASKNVLKQTSEKYQLYYFCIDDNAHTDTYYDEEKYEKLYQYCQHAKKDDFPSLDLQNKIKAEKQKLSGTTDIEQFIITFLSNKMRDASTKPKITLAQKKTGSLSEQIQRAIKQSKRPTPDVTTTPNSGENTNNVEQPTTTNPPSNPPPELSPQDEQVRQQISKSKLIKLREYCETVDPLDFSTTQSNLEEKEASTAYNNKVFDIAEQSYKDAIKSNCNNPYAWANLGILLSDIDNSEGFDALEGVIALQRATEIKADAGWIWHSLCIAETYTKQEDIESAINNKSCQQARLVEPGKQLIYDKLFKIALAEKYQHENKHDKAFKSYQLAIEIDPKRTCRLNKVIESMDKIQKEVKVKNSQDIICNVIKTTYKAEEPDEICETALLHYQKEKC